jgi:hypothetical protein
MKPCGFLRTPTVCSPGAPSILEVFRDWLKSNAVELPRVTVADADAKLKKQVETDGKSNDRQKQLAAALDAFVAAFNCEVHTLPPKMIADYLAALPFRERTKCNHRDTLGFFNRWLVLRGYVCQLHIGNGSQPVREPFNGNGFAARAFTENNFVGRRNRKFWQRLPLLAMKEFFNMRSWTSIGNMAGARDIPSTS